MISYAEKLEYVENFWKFDKKQMMMCIGYYSNASMCRKSYYNWREGKTLPHPLFRKAITRLYTMSSKGCGIKKFLKDIGKFKRGVLDFEHSNYYEKFDNHE